MSRNRPEQIEILLSLALDQRAPDGPCPSPEEIAELTEIPIHKYRQEILDHIVRCRQCYALWLDVVEMTATVRDEYRLFKPSGLTRAKATLREWVFDSRKILFRGGLAATLAGILIVLIWRPVIFRDEFLQYVEYGYGIIEELRSEGFIPRTFTWDQPREMQKKDFDLWENQHEKNQDPARQSFMAGVRAGLEQVAPVTPYWQELITNLPANRPTCKLRDAGDDCRREDRLMFEAGRWAVLIQIVCQSEANQAVSPLGHGPSLLTAFWKSQHKALIQLSKDLATFAPSQADTFRKVMEEWVQRTASASPPLLCGDIKILLIQGLDR